jgi:hypothetical protein
MVALPVLAEFGIHIEAVVELTLIVTQKFIELE